MTSALLATASTTFIIGPIAKFFGWIMNWLFNIGIHNIGINIIVFTIIMYMLQLPLTIYQQKFSRMTALINPEVKEIQKKYRGKKDQASQMKMQEETQAVYDKYGVNMMGGCLPIFIQLPVLYGFYYVIRNVPAYVIALQDVYNKYGLVDAVKSSIDATKFAEFGASVNAIKSTADITNNTIIDVFWKLTDKTWAQLSELGSNVAGFADKVTQTQAAISKYTTFCGLSIAESPLNMFTGALSSKNYLLCVVAILIPVLSGATQMLNMKLMPSASNSSSGDAVGGQLKTMNTMMPLMSVVFCFTLPFGLGIYWIAGAVVRTVQMVLINQYYKKMDIDKLIEKNKGKAEQKAAKRKAKYGSIPTNTSGKTNSRNVNASKISSPERKSEPKAGSLSSKANMVNNYNKKNNNKK